MTKKRTTRNEPELNPALHALLILLAILFGVGKAMSKGVAPPPGDRRG